MISEALHGEVLALGSVEQLAYGGLRWPLATAPQSVVMVVDGCLTFVRDGS